MPLFDLSAHQVRLPPNVIAYASGSNRVSEIRGFALLGIPIGVSVPHLSNKAICELIAADDRVMLDSGAFTEVSCTAKSKSHSYYRVRRKR